MMDLVRTLFDTVPTGLSVNWTTDTKAEVTWDNMNIAHVWFGSTMYVTVR